MAETTFEKMGTIFCNRKLPLNRSWDHWNSVVTQLN